MVVTVVARPRGPPSERLLNTATPISTVCVLQCSDRSGFTTITEGAAPFDYPAVWFNYPQEPIALLALPENTEERE